ncbi:aminopeptidase [Bacillus sp. UNC41MFS5]|uniref:aminopeptidase n=1 Tax=Bacillus sp. UNC41MFS5 TaxID=1449046 RepID=UPI00047AB52B|nr:aminopeptidase [Bacillus sp. UNC41MFS5]
MRTFQEKLEKYAALAVEIGANVQKGQILFISASIESYEFVKLITKRSYEIGASEVIYEWNDDVLTRMKYESAADEVFTDFPTYRVMQREELAEKNAAFILIDSRNPDLLNGIEQERISNFNKASGTALTKFRTYMLSDKIAWTIVAYPNQAWADKVFPNIDKTERINALWDAIFSATRIDHEDTIGAWKEHIAALDSKANYLNGRKYKSLHYRAPGTDLTVELPEKHKWMSAGNHNEKGTLFIANMPTEEVFTSPNKYGVNGIVTSTKPLSYSGNLIENFTLTFKEGKIVDFTCENGYDTLKQLIETDDGSRYLGEIALVPHQSPISKSNTIFYNTLFDENASNHLAIGEGFPFCLDEGKTMSKEELAKIGLNESMTHVDFMIGSRDMDIDGMLPDGRIEPIFRNGNWAF